MHTNSQPPEPKESNRPSDEDLQVVLDLKAIQATQALNDREFAKQYLHYGETVWNRIKSGEYWDMVKDTDRILTSLRLSLDLAQREISQRARYGKSEFYETTESRALKISIQRCRALDLENPRRLIVHLAPTGGGKSAICGHLAKTLGARVIEARESWLRSYCSCLRDFCHAMGLDAGATSARLEEQLVAVLCARRFIIAIDEGEFFCTRALNLLKLILNKTPTIIVLFAIPTAYATWQRNNAHEAQQILRRTHVVSQADAVSPAVAIKFFRRIKLWNDDEAAQLAVGYANAFGHFDMLQRLAEEFEEGTRVKREDFVRAANYVRRKLALSVRDEGEEESSEAA